MWNVKKIIKKGDYNYCLVPEHPHCTKNGYVLEHRIVVENQIGRILGANEVVHHIDGDKKNNRFDNLSIMNNIEHAELHGSTKSQRLVLLRCPNCDKKFVKAKRNTHLSKGGRATFCSRECSGSFNRQVQLNGLTHKLEIAISVNVLSEFNGKENTEETEITGSVETTRDRAEMPKI